jgi:hypothetical protein
MNTRKVDMSGFAFIFIFGVSISILAILAAYGLDRENKKEAAKANKKKRRYALKLSRRAKRHNYPYTMK